MEAKESAQHLQKPFTNLHVIENGTKKSSFH